MRCLTPAVPWPRPSAKALRIGAMSGALKNSKLCVVTCFCSCAVSRQAWEQSAFYPLVIQHQNTDRATIEMSITFCIFDNNGTGTKSCGALLEPLVVMLSGALFAPRTRLEKHTRHEVTDINLWKRSSGCGDGACERLGACRTHGIPRRRPLPRASCRCTTSLHCTVPAGGIKGWRNFKGRTGARSPVPVSTLGVRFTATGAPYSAIRGFPVGNACPAVG